MRFDFNTLQFIETERNPEKLAIAGSDGNISWAELKMKTEELCTVLKDQRVPKGHPVILYGHKEYFFLVAILACIKSNIPYIPIDKVMPVERIKKIQEVSGTQVLIYSGEKNNDLISAVEINKTLLPVISGVISYSDNIYWHEKDPIIYIMFTSGSTGEPKGVQITQNAIGSFMEWMSRDFNFTPNDVFMNQAPFSFDLSVYEIMFSFYIGGSVVLNTDTIVKEGNTFLDRIKKYKCSIWVSTPSFAYLYLSHPDFNSLRIPMLKTFLFCGEILPSRTAKKILEQFPHARLLNTYGPTEATVSTTLVTIDEDIIGTYDILPVGYPKHDCEILIENEQGNNAESGEIIIVGDNVSIGYFKNDTLTNEKFFVHNKKRAYRTGDYGFMKDNMLFYEGRKDEQVKLHGYRIELGEINTRILKIDCVDDAVTIPLKTGSLVKKIISFIILKEKYISRDSECKITIHNILRKQLPEYMIPGDMKFVKAFPVNSNHKTDRKKLIELYLNS